nr:hypothetical protein CFP56_69153 [Quercus suber]
MYWRNCYHDHQADARQKSSSENGRTRGTPSQPATGLLAPESRRLLEPLGRLIPVDDAPVGLDVIWTAVLEFEVVGVLPDVQADDGEAGGGGADDALGHQRTVLVARGDDLQATILLDQPGPARAKDLGGGGLELRAEGVDGAEGLLDSVLERTGQGGAGLEVLPEEGVVGVAASVVTDEGALVSGDLIELGDQIIDGEGAEIGVVLDGAVEVVDVGLVMLGVMDLHGLFVEVGLEGIVGVGELGEGVRHVDARAETRKQQEEGIVS